LAPLAVGLAYLLGSIPAGVLFARARGVDLRAVGSGNIGATNVARALGWAWGAATLGFDAGTGFAAVWIARTLVDDVRWVALAGGAAFVGHLFPVWLRLRGGKGVATGLGVLIALVPWAGAAGAAVWVVLVAATRISSVGSLAGALVAAAVTPLVEREPALRLLAVAMLAGVVVRHAGNLRRLLRGDENGI
jgi:glycerol-3-phosphate acyltransferase PlsY